MDTVTGDFKARRSMVAMRKSIFGHCAGKVYSRFVLERQPSRVHYVPPSVLSKSERKIIVTGGFLDGKYSDRVESYDVDGGYWEVLVGPRPLQSSYFNAISHPNRATEPFTLLEPRMDHSCIVATSSTTARNGSFVVVSGGGNELGILNTTETRDPKTYQWTKAKPETGK